MNKPVKVLEMIASLNYGGSQAMIVNLVKQMNREEVQCDFIVDHPEYDGMKSIVENLGSKIYVVPSFKGTNYSEISKAWNKLFEEHPEYKILHSHSRSYASLYLPIAKKHGLKTIIHSHNTSNGKGFISKIKDVLQFPLRHQADYFIGCSKEAGEWLFGKDIINKENFYVVNNAIDTDKFSYNEDKRKKYRDLFDLGDNKTFIQVGRLSSQKNYLFTLDVFSKYLQIDSNGKLFIVGNGELEEEIRNRINKLELNDAVTILQNRDDVDCLLQMSDIFLMPSLYEGLSVAAVEAQASGILCLCSDNVDRNVNITGLCKFLPLDIDTWVEQMNCKIDNRNSKKDDIIKAGFDVKTTARWLEDFYKEIV